ncbi:MAG: hypothetical protein ABIK82_17415 [Pseudomonadota bacterium]
MSRILRTVCEAEWLLGKAIATRHARLLDVPAPDELLAKLLNEATAAVEAKNVRLVWQPSTEANGFFRVEAVIPLSEETFDQFFNGRSGYRAQYYLSPEEGVLFNRDVLQGLKGCLTEAFAQQLVPVGLDLVLTSLDGPHSKVWVYGEQSPFNNAPEYSLNPRRWVKNNARLGRRAPLPAHLSLELKGAFIHASSGRLFVDELKVDRACDLFAKGYS